MQNLGEETTHYVKDAIIWYRIFSPTIKEIGYQLIRNKRGITPPDHIYNGQFRHKTNKLSFPQLIGSLKDLLLFIKKASVLIRFMDMKRGLYTNFPLF